MQYADMLFGKRTGLQSLHSSGKMLLGNKKKNYKIDLSLDIMYHNSL